MTLIGRDLIIVIGVALGAIVAAMLALQPTALPTVLGFPAAAGAALLVYGVARGNRTATLLHVFAAVFLMQAVFRIRDYQDKEVDFQVIIKIALWITVAAVSLIHFRRWAYVLLKPGNAPALLFLLWLPLTAAVSPNPTYTLVSAFTIFACVVFFAYVFARFPAIDIFVTIVAAITLFCAISIVVYFVIPEFGHYVYWMNEERFVSPRLAGIAGSANNMALIAAFALVLLGLEAREFHRVNPLIIPVAGLICGAALIMTNSRMPLVMTCVIVATAWLATWRRLYAGLFALSAAFLLFAALLPFGQETLLKAVSRSGSVGEITSLTGRTEIWYTVMKLSELAPWMGYGYGSSVFVLPAHMSDIGFATSHAHNLILQLLLTTGGIGVLLFVLTVLGTGLRAIAYRDRMTFGMLAFVILNGITESSGFTTLANICTLAFAVAVTFPSARRAYENHLAYQRGFS
jgi:O-antigen ligase